MPKVLSYLSLSWVVMVPTTNADNIDLKHAASVVGVESVRLFLQDKAPSILGSAGAQNNRKSRIDAVRTWALEYIEALPNFVCTQHDQSFLRYGPADWQKRREIVARLQFISGRESYKTISVNGKPSREPYVRVATGQGHFGSVLHAMFRRRHRARFVHSGDGFTRGRPVDVFKVVHPKGYELFIGVKREGKPKKQVRVGYEGEIHVDKSSPAVVRIVFHRLFGIPSNFPIQQGTLKIDYDSLKIGENYYWLPVERTSTASGKHDSRRASMQTKTHTTWGNYKRFTVETELTF